MLILDIFRGHATEEVKKFLKSRNMEKVIIPGGLASMLQLLDVCINRLFKAVLKEQYTWWMATGEHEYTQTGKIKRRSVEQLCEWIREAWARISPALIEKSFKKLASPTSSMAWRMTIYGTVIPTTRAQWTTMTMKAVEKNTCK
jgi:hypothetical protein